MFDGMPGPGSFTPGGFPGQVPFQPGPMFVDPAMDWDWDDGTGNPDGWWRRRRFPRRRFPWFGKFHKPWGKFGKPWGKGGKHWGKGGKGW